MFAKPYKLKSNTTLKNSEKKHLAQRIQNEFPSIAEDKIKELVPVKSSCICMKLVLHSGETVNVYAVDGAPIMIELEDRLLPTVCALWKIPDLVPTLIIHSPVLPKIQGGAPLYLPGVVTPAVGVGFPLFQRNTVVALCTQDNAAAGVIGRALISSADMLLRAAGVCLETLQVFGDQLCKDTKFGKIERPKKGPASYSQGDIAAGITANVSQLSIQPPKEEWPSLGKKPAPATISQSSTPSSETPSTPATPIAEAKEVIADEDIQDGVNGVDESPVFEDPTIPDDEDGLLRWTFLTFVKLHVTSEDLPFKTNLLYKGLMAHCPPNRTVDVKKTSYKKFSKFMEAMQQEGFVEVREIEKGVSAVSAVNTSHPELVRLKKSALSALRAGPAPPAPAPLYVPPDVREVYCVTAAGQNLFAPHRKGAPLTASEVRAIITEYVKSRNLTSTEVKGAVTLDATLAGAAGRSIGEHVKWDVLMSSTLGRMTEGTLMRYEDGSQQLSKSKLEPVRMRVCTRSGNKKVTLVSNLEQFGFSLEALARVCQVGVAASCGITRMPESKYDQLMLQGDQTHYIAKLLIEKYGLPKKFVDGADKALNKKHK